MLERLQWNQGANSCLKEKRIAHNCGTWAFLEIYCWFFFYFHLLKSAAVSCTLMLHLAVWWLRHENLQRRNHVSNIQLGSGCASYHKTGHFYPYNLPIATHTEMMCSVASLFPQQETKQMTTVCIPPSLFCFPPFFFYSILERKNKEILDFSDSSVF